MEQNIFTLGKVKGGNKRIFIDLVNELPNGTIIKISPFTDWLRARGADGSEESTSRSMRFARRNWGIGVDFVALGKGKYQVVKHA